jgi:hypothetical protein
MTAHLQETQPLGLAGCVDEMAAGDDGIECPPQIESEEVGEHGLGVMNVGQHLW